MALAEDHLAKSYNRSGQRIVDHYTYVLVSDGDLMVLNSIARKLPCLLGGSADLDPSTKTALQELGDFHNPADAGGDLQGSTGGGWSYGGRNLHKQKSKGTGQ